MKVFIISLIFWLVVVWIAILVISHTNGYDKYVKPQPSKDHYCDPSYPRVVPIEKLPKDYTLTRDMD